MESTIVVIRNAVARVKRYESLINIRNQGGTAEFSSLARDVFLFARKTEAMQSEMKRGCLCLHRNRLDFISDYRSKPAIEMKRREIEMHGFDFPDNKNPPGGWQSRAKESS